VLACNACDWVEAQFPPYIAPLTRVFDADRRQFKQSRTVSYEFLLIMRLSNDDINKYKKPAGEWIWDEQRRYWVWEQCWLFLWGAPPSRTRSLVLGIKEERTVALQSSLQ
jgi:hypothetical protein